MELRIFRLPEEYMISAVQNVVHISEFGPNLLSNNRKEKYGTVATVSGLPFYSFQRIPIIFMDFEFTLEKRFP